MLMWHRDAPFWGQHGFTTWLRIVTASQRTVKGSSPDSCCPTAGEHQGASSGACGDRRQILPCSGDDMFFVMSHPASQRKHGKHAMPFALKTAHAVIASLFFSGHEHGRPGCSVAPCETSPLRPPASHAMKLWQQELRVYLQGEGAHALLNS